MVGCSEKSSSRMQYVSRKRKREFHGNRYTKQSCSEPESNLYISASAKKLEVLEETLENAGNEKDNYSFIMNFNERCITEIVKCPECECTVHIVDNKPSLMGFSHMFFISCSSCDWQKLFYSSKECSNKDIKMQGRKPFETNVQTIVGFCEIGCGFSAIGNFTRCMNVHSIAKTPFDKLNHEIAKAYEAKASTKAEEYRDNTTLEPTKMRAKFDGDLQKRGHVSLNG